MPIFNLKLFTGYRITVRGPSFRIPASFFRALQHMRNSGGPECALPFAADPRNVAVGPTRVHPRSAKAAGNAQV